MKLASKVALITGGAQGLGKAIALAMAREGASIVICDINPKTLPDAEAEIQSTGVRCLGVKCDVSSVESVANLFRETVATFDTLDVWSTMPLSCSPEHTMRKCAPRYTR